MATQVLNNSGGGGIECLINDVAVEDDISFHKIKTLPINYIPSNVGKLLLYKDELHMLGSNNESYAKLHILIPDGVYFEMNAYGSVSHKSTLPYSFQTSSYGSNVVIFNNSIHIFGGESTMKNHYAWDGSSWTSYGTLPQAYTYAKIIVYRGEIHYIANQYHYKSSNGRSWTSVATAPGLTGNCVCVVYNDKIHLLSAMASVYPAKHFVYDGQSWSEDFADIPCRTSEVSNLIVYDGKMHLIHNYTPSTGVGYSDNLKHYEYDNTGWHYIGSTPGDFYSNTSLISTADGIMAFGLSLGYINSSDTRRAVQIYNKNNEKHMVFCLKSSGTLYTNYSYGDFIYSQDNILYFLGPASSYFSKYFAKYNTNAYSWTDSGLTTPPTNYESVCSACSKNGDIYCDFSNRSRYESIYCWNKNDNSWTSIVSGLIPGITTDDSVIFKSIACLNNSILCFFVDWYSVSESKWKLTVYQILSGTLQPHITIDGNLLNSNATVLSYNNAIYIINWQKVVIYDGSSITTKTLTNARVRFHNWAVVLDDKIHMFDSKSDDNYKLHHWTYDGENEIEIDDTDYYPTGIGSSSDVGPSFYVLNDEINYQSSSSSRGILRETSWEPGGMYKYVRQY